MSNITFKNAKEFMEKFGIIEEVEKIISKKIELINKKLCSISDCKESAARNWVDFNTCVKHDVCIDHFEALKRAAQLKYSPMSSNNIGASFNEFMDEVNEGHQRATVHLPIELIERVKNIVYWEPGLTLSDFYSSALKVAIAHWESKNGGKYAKRKENLKGGRPLK